MNRILRFLTSPQFLVISFIFIALAIGLKLYTDMRPDEVAVDTNDKTKPQYPYRKDEFALLQIALDKVMQAENEKRYGDMYSQMISRRFQHNVPHRIFMKMTNCVEQYLGGIVSYDHDNLGFRREKRKGQIVDILQLHVERTETPIEEQLVFEWDGVDVKLGGIYWMTNRLPFHDCVREIRAQKPQLHETGALQGVTESSEKKSTELAPKSDASAAQTETHKNSESDHAPTGNSPTNNTTGSTNPDRLPTSQPSSTDTHHDADSGQQGGPAKTTILQDEAGKDNSITDFGPEPSERIQPGESSKPAE